MMRRLVFSLVILLTLATWVEAHPRYHRGRTLVFARRPPAYGAYYAPRPACGPPIVYRRPCYRRYAPIYYGGCGPRYCGPRVAVAIGW